MPQRDMLNNVHIKEDIVQKVGLRYIVYKTNWHRVNQRSDR
jgi:hypothetical protein